MAEKRPQRPEPKGLRRRRRGHGQEHRDSEAFRLREVERRLEETERRLRETQRIANLGSWDWNIATDSIWWSDQTYRIFGFEPGSFGANYESFLNVVHKDDRVKVMRAVNVALAESAPFDVTHRIVLPDGLTRIVHVRATIVRDSKGVNRLTGTIQDVTEQHRADQALRASETRLSTIIDIAPEAVIATSTDGTIRIFNRGAEAVFGYSASEIVGRPLDVLIPPAERLAHREHIRKFEESSEMRRLMHRRKAIEGLRKDGSTFPAAAAISKIDIGGERIFVAILRDETSQHAAETELRNALRAAEDANNAKSQFLAIMSHELRTPLNAILGFAQILREQGFGPLGNDKYAEYAHDIFISGEHLLALVNNLLHFSAGESDNDRLDRQPVDVVDLVEDCVRVVSDSAREKGIDVRFDKGASPPMMQGDRRAVYQILLNLLSNSIKYTPKDGRVSVSCGQTTNMVTIAVADTGVGIPPEIIPKLTEPFNGVDQDPYVAGKGWGMGLSISKSLVDQLGGFMEIISGIGKGTVVRIGFPRADSPGSGRKGTPALVPI